MARTRLVAGNWKMHGSRSANRVLVDAILKGMTKDAAQCAVCPPFPYLADVAERLRGTALALGAQNVSQHAQGAHTGEVSAAMLKELGCRYVLVGHSERRQIYGKRDAQVAANFAMPDVDGGLIGGASLVAEDFLAILQAAGTKGK